MFVAMFCNEKLDHRGYSLNECKPKEVYLFREIRFLKNPALQEFGSGVCSKSHVVEAWPPVW